VGDRQEGVFHLPWSYLWESKAASSSCALARRDREGLFPLDAPLGSSRRMPGGQVHALAEERRREVVYKGDELNGPFALDDLLPTGLKPKNPAIA